MHALIEFIDFPLTWIICQLYISRFIVSNLWNDQTLQTAFFVSGAAFYL